MKNLIFSVLFMLICFVSYSQNEANNWYFGENAGLNFSNDDPVPLLNGQLNTGEGCASISDTDGNLLFYTDGITVFNASHGAMPNGTELNGDFSSTHSAIIIPKPNSSNIYYIFTSDDDGGEFGLQYSEVDITLDSGSGDITANKNILLYTPITEKLTAIKHATLNEYWVISHKYGNNEFLAYRVSENGVDTEPIISATGLDIPVSLNKGNTRGQIKISPDGTKLVVVRSAPAIENGGVQLFDFNSSTGQISNPKDIPIYFGTLSIQAYGIEFSPNSQILYVSSGVGIFQYDLTTSIIGEILISQHTVVTNTSSAYGYGGMQLGPNGKIYIAEWDNLYLHIINAPNNLGANCNYEEDGVYLAGKKSKLGLPPFIQSFFLVGFQVENLCEDSSVEFTANISQSYDSIVWNFGDGNTSTNENPSHTFTTPGNYEVTLSVTSGTDNSIETQTITVYEQPNVTPIVELRQCDDNSDGFSSFNLNEATLEITSNSVNETITFHESLFNAQNNISPITNSISYINEIATSDIVWARVENSNNCYDTSQIHLTVSTTQIPNTFIRNFYQCDDGADNTDGIATFNFSSVVSEVLGLFPVGQQLDINFYRNQADALSEINPITDISNYQNIGYPNSQGIYIRVDNALNNDCLGLGHYINLYVQTVPQINSIPDEISICEGGSVELIADEGYDSYNWSTGEMTRVITVEEPGQYTITVTNEYSNLICSINKTITVTASDIAIISEIETLDWTQNNNVISIFVEGLGDYEYSIDGFNYQDSSVFLGLNADEYTVYVRDKNGCGIVNENVYLIYYPRYFTPNDDGKNDAWQIINATQEPLNRLYIFNRYGKLITQLKPNDFGWDGTYNGNKMPSSDYWFVLERQDGKTYTGHFTLKR